MAAGEVEALRSRVAQLEAERANWQEERSRCRLVWEDRPDPGVVAARERLPLLVEEPSLAIGDGDHPHLLIEGDNYHALLELTYTHRGQLNVIYIDPPYNTHSAAIPYDDNFDHSTWLSVMEPRLRLAWDLLSPSGVLLIQIGLDEVARLRLLGDIVFGAGSFVTTIAVRMSAVQGLKVAAAKAGNIVKNTEYVQVWAKNGREDIGLRPLYEAAPYDPHYSLFLEPTSVIGEFVETDLPVAIMKEAHLRGSLAALELLDSVTGFLPKNRLAEAYEMSPPLRAWIHAHGEQIVRDDNVTSLSLPPSVAERIVPGRTVRWSSRSRSYLIGRNSKGTIRQRIPLTEKIQLVAGIKPVRRISTMRGDWWDGYYLDMGNVGKEANMTFLSGKKPVRLIKDLIRLVSPPDALVLDFFAGSGSTGHAVLELNREDGGTRRFVLVTSNEAETDDRGRPTGRLICRDICYPRLHNVLVGYERGKTHVAGLGGSLRYLVADRVGLSAADALIPDRASQVVAALAEDTLRVRADCFRLVERRPEFVVFESGQRLLAILHRYSARAALVGVLKPIVGEREVHIYPFAPENVADTKWFRDQLGERTLVMRLPDEITHTYERLILGARRA